MRSGRPDVCAPPLPGEVNQGSCRSPSAENVRACRLRRSCSHSAGIAFQPDLWRTSPIIRWDIVKSGLGQCPGDPPVLPRPCHVGANDPVTGRV